MTNSRLLAILLSLASLCSCQSTTTENNRPVREVSAAVAARRAIDYSYLLDDRKLADEERQALDAGRLKELSPAQMRDLEDAYDSKRRQRRGEWLEARARFSQK
jgi:hypothetical protein